MTVGELVKKLEGFPDNLEIKVSEGEGCSNYTYEDLKAEQIQVIILAGKEVLTI